jgi:hypothetical protein
MTTLTLNPPAAAGIDWSGRSKTWFLLLLGITLVGYATFNRSFAYLGVKPIFIGEVCVLLGLFAALHCRRTSLGGALRLCWPLLPLVAWGAFCTLPYFGEHQFMALRDAVIWGYSVFAFVLVAVFLDDPNRMRQLLRWMKVYAILFLVITPFTMAAVKMYSVDHLGGGMPMLPWAEVPIVMAKGGDVGVHLAMVTGYIVLLGALPGWLVLLTLPVNGVLMQSSRAALVCFAAALVPMFFYRPKHPLLWGLLAWLTIGFIVLLITGLAWSPPGEKREFSAKNIIQSVQSLYGDAGHEEMSGTKEWRKNWWADIIDYTFHGDYFMTGKGYGVSLADADGYQVEFDETPLRSPHNGHLTFLARSGVPGFGTWVLANLAWFAIVFAAFYRCHVRSHLPGSQEWARLLLWMGIAWGVFLLNTTFDVFLEGPMGGIWFWSIYGTGLAAAQLSQTRPELLIGMIPNDHPADSPKT